jgi:hypothetical protein
MQIIIIGGAMRSGTTLLNNMICNSDRTNPVVEESHLLTHFLSGYRLAKGSIKQLKGHYFQDEESLRKFFATHVLDFFNNMSLVHHHPEYLVVKNPEFTPLIMDFLELIPEAKILISVRDPRDTVVSMCDVIGKMKRNNHHSGLASLDGNITGLARHYMNYYLHMIYFLSKKPNPNIVFVRYESLVEETKDYKKQLETFLGFDIPTYQVSDLYKKEHSNHQENNYFITELMGKSVVSNESIGRYKSVLTREQIQHIERECRSIMKLFNYNASE